MINFQVFDDISIQSLITFIIGVAVTLIIVSIINYTSKRYIKKAIEDEPKLKTTYTFIIRLVIILVSLLGVSFTVFSAFPHLANAITSIFFAAGFASIVVGLAAQASLSNIVSGALIAFTHPFKIGEGVKFKEDFCFVEDIKLTYSVFRTWDNRRLIIPNSMFQSEVIANYYSEDTTMLAPFYVQVSYESDVKKAMDIMVEVAKKHPDCLPIGNLPNAVLMEFADSGITLRGLSRAKDQPTVFMMTRDILFEIKKEFDAQGIEIPYPRRYLVLDKKIEDKITKFMEAYNTSNSKESS